MDIIASLNLQLIGELNKEGKNSSVYVMRDTQLNTELVVKVVLKSEFLNSNEYFNEAAILYDVQHENIVKIQHATEIKDYVLFSMPFYKKGSLESIINSKYLSVKEIIQYSLDFLNGLHYVHTKGLIHFDIKPTNILIHDCGKALLTDFGLSKYVDAFGLSSPDKIYPIHYPPEMIQGNLMSNKADIYQAGMTLYRMCNGNENFYLQVSKYKTIDEFKHAVLNGKFPDRKYFLPHIPNKLRSIIKKAISTSPDNRYRTALDMINDLSAIDKNLNISYSYNKNTCSYEWVIPSSNTHNNCIILNKTVNTYSIIAQKVRILDNKRSTIHRLCSDGYSKMYDAFKQVERIFNDQ